MVNLCPLIFTTAPGFCWDRNYNSESAFALFFSGERVLRSAMSNLLTGVTKKGSKSTYLFSSFYSCIFCKEVIKVAVVFPHLRLSGLPKDFISFQS